MKGCNTQEYTNYPRNLIFFKTESKRFHQTQKPVDLLMYLIKTYTREGETVLDNCMGSGSTGVACLHTGREFIGIEKDEEIFNIAKERIKKEKQNIGKEIDGVYYTLEEILAYTE